MSAGAGSESTHATKDKAAEAARDASRRALSFAEQQKSSIADSLGGVAQAEMDRVFNGGIGFVIGIAVKLGLAFSMVGLFLAAWFVF